MRRFNSVPWLTGLVLLMASCGSGSFEATSQPDSTSSASSEAGTDSVESESDESGDNSSEGGVETVDDSTDDTESGWTVAVDLAAEPGARPTFEWDEVDGAATYELYVMTSDGDAYWAWLGEDTSTALGGLPLLEPGASGPRLSVGMTWEIAALDADGESLLTSGGGFPAG